MADPTRPAEERDRIVLRLYEQLLEIEQRLIPTGMHVFGRPNAQTERADMLRMIASFDRPEMGFRSLPGQIAAGLGFPEYQVLMGESATSGERLLQRELVDAILRSAIEKLLAEDGGIEEAASLLARESSIPTEDSTRMLAFLIDLDRQLGINHEVDELMRALRGEYIEPGPGGDLVQNPKILPTGRNTHAVNPYAVPSRVAFQKSQETIGRLLNRCLEERGRYPETIGMVIWGMDNIKTQGEGVAQALLLMGVVPKRDGMNRVTDVEIIPLETLGRPRIDVVFVLSGIFRDLFGTTMELLDKAARKVAGLDEPPEVNFLRKHVQQAQREGMSWCDAATRLFSNAPGNYGTNVNFMVIGGHWDRTEQIGDLFVTRKCFAYGRGLDGDPARTLMDKALSRVEVTYQNLDNAEIGITDVDHYFEYLGGLTQAVEQRTVERPATYVCDSLSPLVKIRSLNETVRLEVRTKLLNPKWYGGMLKHGFSGVAEIEHHVSNTFGWSATAGAVDDWIYSEIANTYVVDEAMRQRLAELNPHATRSLAQRLLEAHGRGFWAAQQSVLDHLHNALDKLEDHLEGVNGQASRASQGL